jgi:adenosyl cobinamide kinase/adenosyl cobinamide phosphate guanylyltransferase
VEEQAVGGAPWLAKVTVPELLKETAAIVGGRRSSVDIVEAAEAWPQQSMGQGIHVAAGQRVDHRVQPARAVLHREVKPEQLC